MFKNLTIGQHYPVDSPIHNLDPRLKIIMTFIFIISLFLIESFTGFIFVIIFLTVIITISKVPVKFVIKVTFAGKQGGTARILSSLTATAVSGERFLYFY